MNPLFDYFENLSTNCLQNNNLLLNYDYEPIINDINDLSELNNLFFEPNYSNNNTNELPKNIISSQNTNSPEINQIIRPKTKLLGRKKKNSGEIGKHNKYAENNMTRKMKVIIKNDLLDFINSKIKKELNLTNIIINGDKYLNNEIKLLNIKQKQMIDITVDGNITFLNTKIRDILSEQISNNNQLKYPSDFNAILIKTIYQIENGESITSILDMTFLECLKYYRKDEDIINDAKYSCLKGLEKGFENLKERLMNNNEEEDYVDKLIELIQKFEVIYSTKKSRAKRVKKI